MPDVERLERMKDVVAGFVEENVADTPAEDDAERRPHEEVVDVLAASEMWRPPGESETITPADQQPDDIGERVPADRHGAERDRDRINRRERDQKKRDHRERIPGQTPRSAEAAAEA